MYNLLNDQNKPMRAFAKKIGSTSNKVQDYLREKGVLYYCNEPSPGYEDWFKFKFPFRFDLTPLGELKVKQLIEQDGLTYVNKEK